MESSLLDTDILTEIFKARNHQVTSHASAYLQEHGQFAISAMTRFEIVRGLRHKRATALLARFETVCARLLVIPISDEVLDQAANLWVAARDAGHPQRDADLIIAATAIVNSRTLITGNSPHFRWISGLPIANWRDA
jgi:predicted nucleic acid-binding protein